MEKKKLDGRVKYTRMVIKNSFIALLCEKPVAKITVTEICADAGINRATFYSHYSDPYDLLRSVEEGVMADINNGVGDVFSSAGADLMLTLSWVFEYISENAKECIVLLSDRGDPSFQAKVVSMLQARFIAGWPKASSMTVEDAEYLFSYAAIGSVGMIRKWLAEGMKKPPREMAELVVKLANKGYSAFN